MTPEFDWDMPVPLRMMEFSRSHIVAPAEVAEAATLEFSLSTDCVTTTSAVDGGEGNAVTPTMLRATVLRSTVTCAVALPVGETPMPVPELAVNSLSRTSTAKLPVDGATRRPVWLPRMVLPEILTRMPPETSTPKEDRFEMTTFSRFTSPACTSTPCVPPWPLIVRPRSTTLVAGLATVTPGVPGNTLMPAYTPAGDWMLTFLFTVTDP